MRYIILLMFSLSKTVSIYAEETESDIVIEMTPGSTDEKGKGKDHGNRMPPHRVICIINTDYGVSLSGIDSSEIEMYEIWDTTGENLVAAYTDEMSFVEYLFSLKGDYILKFRTEFRIFDGFIRI